MSRIVIGKSGSHNVSLDLEVLLTTRMLVTSDSGGGKTFLLKRICEQAFGKIQIIIVDPEGEFAPLRKKFDFVLAGPGGETPTDVRSAALLAQRLLEVRASAICDIYDMKPSERHVWVKLFLEALIEAPKKLRHPCLVIVDEAHIFCPEKGKGESQAGEAMIALCTRGRKRLLAALFATQRLATLSKDASSMLLNRLIGPTFEDINRKRAADVLGIMKADEREFFKEIQLLEPGKFYALGRAICREKTKVHVGPIETPHGEEALKYETAPPPPLEKVKALLPKLKDLPRQAEEQAKTAAEFKAQIRELKAQLRAQPGVPIAARVTTKVVTDEKAVGRAVDQVERQYKQRVANIYQSRQGLVLGVARLARELAKIRDLAITAQESAASAAAFTSKPDDLKPIERPKIPSGPAKVAPAPQPAAVVRSSASPATGGAGAARSKSEDLAALNGDLTKPQIKVLRALAEFEAIGREEVSRAWIAARAGASVTSSAFGNNLGALRTAGMIEYPRGRFARLTEAGRSAAPHVDPPTDSKEMLESCLALCNESQRKILQVLFTLHPKEMEKAELAEQVGASATSSAFGNNLGALRTAGMIEYPRGGTAKCADWLFID